ncbi:DUF4390 domain-containing protein [Pusillimonas sp. DMV24BSW_D]|uniref:DUF4390 domain-containing protein n=1 Tax=Neopusillimonas aestuarii TaxID=2716226 RepID=UPI0014092544|nr:DUF4390 domain-containing protein [Pusillimonas sp. DMV24BSW_D]QIM48645.1 DUF4390 domain-containing protein [Pusillimonas sp. DMV24BSW_D]
MIALFHRPLLFIIVAFMVSVGVVCAQSTQFVSVEPIVRDGSLYIDANADIEVTGELRNAAEKGVPLYFTADLEIVSSRWWWFDKVLVDEQRSWRLSYNVLTQQWRVSVGDLTLPEDTFDDALSFVKHIRGWAVGSTDLFDPDEEYEGRIRLRLDTSRLPRPVRVDAFNSSAWSVMTPWKDFRFSISPPVQKP